MQSFSRGWSFLTQAWQMAFKDKDLIKPSIYALLVPQQSKVVGQFAAFQRTKFNMSLQINVVAALVGFFVSIIGIIPIVGAYLLLGDSGFGQALTFVLGALMVFVNFVVTYVFSGKTAYLIFAFTLVASVISSYIGVAYHTCLYIWAREAEKAQALGQPIQIAAPAPLAAVLG